MSRKKNICRQIDFLSEDERTALKEILEQEYPGRYSFFVNAFDRESVEINSTNQKFEDLVIRAMERAHGSKGRLVTIRKIQERTIWVHADSTKEAFEKAIKSGDRIPFKDQPEYECSLVIKRFVFPKRWYGKDDLPFIYD